MVKKVPQKHGGTLHVIQKGDKGRNKTGRPRKGISLVNHELTKWGYAPATKQDIQENYMSMLQLSEKELKTLLGDGSKPMIVRIIAKAMLGGKGFDIVERMIDRAHGKAAITMGDPEKEALGSLAAGLLSLSKVKQKDEK